jgi:hypothetical protein
LRWRAVFAVLRNRGTKFGTAAIGSQTVENRRRLEENELGDLAYAPQHKEIFG